MNIFYKKLYVGTCIIFLLLTMSSVIAEEQTSVCQAGEDRLTRTITVDSSEQIVASVITNHEGIIVVNTFMDVGLTNGGFAVSKLWKNGAMLELEGNSKPGARVISKNASIRETVSMNYTFAVDSGDTIEMKVFKRMEGEWADYPLATVFDKHTGMSYMVLCPTPPPPPDQDHDNVADDIDNCPTLFNPDQLDNDENKVGDDCQDTDGDGLFDGVFYEIDNCPMVYNPDQFDTDWDGVGDACDNCKNAFNPYQIDSNNDGVGDSCDPIIDYNDLIQEGIDQCKENPASCDLYSEADQEAVRQEGIQQGRQQCIDNPESCGLFSEKTSTGENETYPDDENCKHATYSIKKRTLTIPVIEIPVIDFLVGLPTGEIELWTGEMRQIYGTTNRFKILSKTVKQITDGSNSSCPAAYNVETNALSIPYVDIPVGIVIGNTKLENEVDVFTATMAWEPIGKSFVVQDIKQLP